MEAFQPLVRRSYSWSAVPSGMPKQGSNRCGSTKWLITTAAPEGSLLLTHSPHLCTAWGCIPGCEVVHVYVLLDQAQVKVPPNTHRMYLTDTLSCEHPQTSTAVCHTLLTSPNCRFTQTEAGRRADRYFAVSPTCRISFPTSTASCFHWHGP